MIKLKLATRFATPLAALGATVLLAACAATPQAGSEVLAAQAKVAQPRLDCLKTGTRIALKSGECSSSSGRVFTKEELDRTGETNTAEALRQLDPSIGR